jgi:hypothetical protein
MKLKSPAASGIAAGPEIVASLPLECFWCWVAIRKSLQRRSRHSDTATGSKVESVGVGIEVSPVVAVHGSFKKRILLTINSNS